VKGETLSTRSAISRLRINRRRYFVASRVVILLFPVALVFAHEPITTKVRFNKEVIRALQRSCLDCHRPGGIAMSLVTYNEARPWAKAIKEEMLERRMPPWHAVKGYGEFRNAPELTQREIDMIVNWVEGGAPKGDDADLPRLPLYSDDWRSGKPDVTLKISGERRVAAETSEYRTFVVPTGLKEDRWLTAIDLRPGNGAVVHCATIYLEGKREPSASRAGNARLKMTGIQDLATPISAVKDSEFHLKTSLVLSSSTRPEGLGTLTQGYGAREDARGLVFGAVLATWIPGQKSVTLPAGVARLLPASSRLLVTVHYRGADEETKDSSSLGLYFTKSPPKKLASDLVITDSGTLIPAGDVRKVSTSITVSEETEALGIRPRPNPLLISLQATAHKPDGSEEVLIWSQGYQSDWQQTYYFKRTVALPKGTRIEVIAYFDNTEENQNNPYSPPRQVSWSDLSSDPLCTVIVTKDRNSSGRAVASD
jgi:hypothetical protein